MHQPSQAPPVSHAVTAARPVSPGRTRPAPALSHAAADAVGTQGTLRSKQAPIDMVSGTNRAAPTAAGSAQNPTFAHSPLAPFSPLSPVLHTLGDLHLNHHRHALSAPGLPSSPMAAGGFPHNALPPHPHPVPHLPQTAPGISPSPMRPGAAPGSPCAVCGGVGGGSLSSPTTTHVLSSSPRLAAESVRADGHCSHGFPPTAPGTSPSPLGPTRFGGGGGGGGGGVNPGSWKDQQGGVGRSSSSGSSSGTPPSPSLPQDLWPSLVSLADQLMGLVGAVVGADMPGLLAALSKRQETACAGGWRVGAAGDGFA